MNLLSPFEGLAQPRPQGFSLKKWVGWPTHFSREKPWGRGWVWLRSWGLGCESIQTEDTIPAVEVKIRFAFNFASVISYNINLSGSTFYFFQLSHLYIMARRLKTQKSVTRPPQPLSWKEFLKNRDVVVNSRTLFFFFIRMLFFRPRLNILIFLPILGWKYSCIILK